MLSLDEILRHAAAQRARAIKSHHRDQVLEAIRVELHQQIGEALGLGLEDADGVAGTKHGAGLLVYVGDLVDVDVDTPIRFDHFQSVADDREIAQTQKIHLEKAQLLYLVFFVLGLDEIVLGELDGHVLIYRLRTNHHAGGVGAGIAGEPFQVQAVIDERVHRAIGVIEVFKFL